MSTAVLVFIAVDIVITVAVVLWLVKKRTGEVQKLRQRVAQLEGAGGLSTAAVLEAARARGATTEAGTFAERLATLTGRQDGLAPDVVVAIQQDLRDGQLIYAIKRVREATGLGLKEAKDVVDRLKAEFDR